MNAEASPARSRHRVLVVDADSAVTGLMASLLEDHGYDAAAAHDLEGALNAVRESRPRLIVIDLAMPDAQGHALVQALSRDPATRDIPLALVSAFTQIVPSGDRRKVVYLLGRPFDVAEMLAIVEASVGNPYV